MIAKLDSKVTLFLIKKFRNLQSKQRNGHFYGTVKPSCSHLFCAETAELQKQQIHNSDSQGNQAQITFCRRS